MSFSGETVADVVVPARHSVQCVAVCTPDEDGGFSVIGINLPGAMSDGETREQAVQNFREACRALIGHYRRSGRPLPWDNDVNIPADDLSRDGSCLLGVAVDVD